MPDQNNQPLPPLEKDSYDGYKEEAAIHRDNPLPKSCNHKNAKLISGTEIRCGCGVGYTGANILELYKLLQAQ